MTQPVATLPDALLRLLPDAVLSVAHDWRLTAVNAQAERLLGQDEAALLGRELWGVLPTLRDTAVGPAAEEAMRNLVPGRTEIFLPGPDGWYDAQLIPAGGGLGVVLRDLTAQHDAEVLAALGDTLLSATTPEGVSELALTQIGPVLQATSMQVVRFGHGGLEMPTLWGDTPRTILQYLARPRLRLADLPILSRVAAEGRGVYLDDYLADPEAVRTIPGLGLAAEPIYTPDGSLQGVLVVWKPAGTALWRSADRRLLCRAAGTLGLALERASAVAKLEAQVRQTQDEANARDAFVAFTEAAGSETDVRALAARAVEVLSIRFPGCTVSYHELEDRLWKSRVFSPDLYDNAALLEALQAGLPFDTPIFAGALRGSLPVFVDAWDPEREQIEDSEEYRTAASYPLVQEGEIRAVLAIGLKDKNQWSEPDRAVFRAVGRSLALALERAEQGARLAAQNTELAAQARALEGFAELTGELGTQDQPLALIRRAQEVVLGLLPPGSATYYELEVDLWRVKSQVGSLHQPELQAAIDQGLPYATAQNLVVPYLSRQPYYQEIYDLETDQLQDITQHIGATATLPVVVNGDVCGVFAVALFGQRPWSATDKAVLVTVIRSLQLALEGARTRQALNRTQHYLRVVAEHAPILLFATDSSGVFTLSEGSLLAKLGRGDGPAIGQTSLSLFSPEASSRTGDQVRRALAGELVHDLLHVDPAGAVFETWFAPVRDASGTVVEVAGVSLDVTDRILAQRQVEQANEGLARSNAELTVANEELEAFAYSASHDLRTPVRHVKGFSELARMALGQGATEKALKHLGVVETAADRMSTLIDAMLDLSRNTRKELQPGQVDLGELVIRAQADVAPELTGRTVTWKVQALPVIQGDQITLQQVMTNLLSNAVKFSRTRHEAIIEIWAESRRSEWAVHVRDNGVGFDPEYREKLFGVFKRLHSDREFEGTGVGLATVRRIVLRHGGQVSAESAKGQGATFSFTLPKSR